MEIKTQPSHSVVIVIYSYEHKPKYFLDGVTYVESSKPLAKDDELNRAEFMDFIGTPFDMVGFYRANDRYQANLSYHSGHETVAYALINHTDRHKVYPDKENGKKITNKNILSTILFGSYDKEKTRGINTRIEQLQRQHDLKLCQARLLQHLWKKRNESGLFAVSKTPTTGDRADLKFLIVRNNSIHNISELVAKITDHTYLEDARSLRRVETRDNIAAKTLTEFFEAIAPTTHSDGFEPCAASSYSVV